MEMTVLIDMYSRLLTVQDRERILKCCSVVWYVIVYDGVTTMLYTCYFKVFPKMHCLTMIPYPKKNGS